MRFRRFAVALVWAAVPLLAGCFQSSTLVKLNPDGSGTLEQTTTIRKDLVARLQSLAAAAGDTDEVDQPDPFSVDEARAAAGNMGDGVTFVSADRIDTRELRGIKAVYAFKDIRALSLSRMDAPAGAEIGVVPDILTDLTFTELPNGHSLLTIENQTDALMPSQDGVEDKGALDMMKAQFAGLKVDFAVQVSHLVKTNVPYVSGGTVTLLSVDFDRVLANPAAFERMQKAGWPADSKALRGVKGIKVSPDAKLTIEFGK